MNYPLDGLAIIGPILFIVLLVAFPVIGVFAGWKRAAYWGGATFVFYIIGMLIYRFTGQSIANLLAPTIAKLINRPEITAEQLTNMTKSLVGPAFFVLYFAVVELILLINYYAWFKKVSGIKKDVVIKKALKQARKTQQEVKIDNTNPKIAKLNIQQADIDRIKNPRNKTLNYVLGGSGLLLLTVPSTMTFAQSVMYVTTSSSTRANNSFASGLYNGLNGFNQSASWFSFYGGQDVGEDYNALFSALHLTDKKLTKIIDPVTGQETIVESGKQILDVLSDTVTKGLENVTTKVKEQSEGTSSAQEVATAVDNFTKSWNNIINSAEADLTGLLNSSNLISLIEKSLEPTSKKQLTDADIESLTKDNTIDEILAGVANGKLIIGQEEFNISIIKKLSVSNQAKEEIKVLLTGNFELGGLSAESLKKFDETLTKVMKLILA